jgi:hypothetical protein
MHLARSGFDDRRDSRELLFSDHTFYHTSMMVKVYLFPFAPRPHKLLVDLKYIVSTDYDLIAGAQYELGRGADIRYC